MIYKVLASSVILLHFFWILFIIFGAFFVIKRPWIAWVHVGGLLFSLLLNFLGLYCPLTYLENYLHSFLDIQSRYSGPFIVTYLEVLIYPDLPERYLRGLEILFASLYIIFYAYLAKKHHILRKIMRS